MPDVSPAINTILFDWDGTLADSARMGFYAFDRTFQELGLPFDEAVYERIYSPNWYLMYEAVGLPRSRWQRADELWMHHYGQEAIRLVEGGRRMVLDLRRRGYRLGVVSGGSGGRVRREIESSEMLAAFEVVVCSEDTVRKKPHPEGLQMAMRAMGRPPATCAYVGDSPEDIEMSRRAGLLAIAVRSEYPGGKRIRDAGPDLFLNSVIQLLDHFQVLGRDPVRRT